MYKNVLLTSSSIVITCVTLSGVRWWRYRLHLVRMRTKDGNTRHDSDNSSQREMILSPSDHSSVNCPSSSGGCYNNYNCNPRGGQSNNQTMSHSVSSRCKSNHNKLECLKKVDFLNSSLCARLHSKIAKRVYYYFLNRT